MVIAGTYTHVDSRNIEQVRQQVLGVAADQARELTPGCETWGIKYAGGQRGQMTRWPDGRGAVSFGDDSIWGDWRGDILVCGDGTRYDNNGVLVTKL